MPNFQHPDLIRGAFARAMSGMYQAEVPQYGELLQLVAEINAAVLAADPALRERLAAAGELERLDVERHGAIRLGSARELHDIRRLFAVMGMHPVGYYDLSVAGLPVHSTAFRPIDSAALASNPFRIFTSLLRLDLLEDRALAEQARVILERREIVTPRALELIQLAEAQGGLTDVEAGEFVGQALETFRWHARATVDPQTYEALRAAHGLVADVVSFPGPHINHLTPRTLDIDAVQHAMPARGIAPKAVIEGPPRRKTPILLRQTSFKALSEPVVFESGEAGAHTARFGEIEQRGIALTPRGRARYDAALAKALTAEAGDGYEVELARQFRDFPDDCHSLRREGLAYFLYRAVTERAPSVPVEDLETLLQAGALVADPQIYEDFLPVSAAGIFRSNLGSEASPVFRENSNQAAFEQALGAEVIDPFELYARIESESLRAAMAELNQSPDTSR